MSAENSNVAVVRSYLEAVERFDTEAARKLLHPGVVQTEKPNKLSPSGQQRGLELMMRDLPRGAKILRSQRYGIETIFGAGDRVAVAARWQGVLDVPLGRLAPGETMVAHTAMLLRLEDGRIIEQVNYDCFEDFGTVA